MDLLLVTAVPAMFMAPWLSLSMRMGTRSTDRLLLLVKWISIRNYISNIRADKPEVFDCCEVQ